MVRYAAIVCILLECCICGTGCRNDPDAEKPRVEDLQFVNPKIEMKIGERQAVKVNVKPAEARKHHIVEYTASVEGYVSITETSNDGCVLTAEKGGTVVIVAKADGYTAYLEVDIDGEEIVQVPYIMVPTQVIEVLEGARKTVQVSLYNGNAIDQQQFKWELETGKDNISINPTGNTVVVQGEKRGSQKIIVKHDKSEFTAEILVFVLGVSEQARYITSGRNVITMTAGGPSHELTATLVGGSATDISGFTFSIIEENPCIEILPSNNSCSIAAGRKGTAVIRITHPLAEYPLEVRVIVLQGEESYIELDKAFLVLDIGKGDFITAKTGGYCLQNWDADFTFVKKGDVNCIDINQTNFSFYITARSGGRCIVEISNPHIQYSREALVVVRDQNTVAPDEYYITTSQNVIQLEAGKEIATQLSIQLINGIEADKAGFEWTVEDGRVITAEPLDLPDGKNVNYITRSMRNRASAEIKSVASTLALITPKKTGSTKIIITHPKSKSAATVICKVYPRGTFGDMQYIVGRKEGSLIKIDTTVQKQTGKDTPVNLYMVQGDPLSVGKLAWEIKGCGIENPEIIATVQDLSGLDNEIHGTGKGINKLIVNNADTLKYPFEAVVMAGTTEELAMMAVLYVDQVYQTVAAGQSISVPVLNSGMVNNQPNGLSENDQYYVENYDKRLLAATMIKNRLLLQGLSDGSTTVTVKNRTSTEIIPVEIKVTVLPELATIDKPYMLTGPNFIGMNWGDTNVELKVKLSGDTMDASVVEKDRVKWSSSNGSMVRVCGNGETCLLTAGNGTAPSNPAEMTGQANIVARHDRSVNDKVTVAYVVPPGADPLKAVVLGIAQDHWLLKPDEEVMMYLLTNADETADRDINKIKWLDRNGADYKANGSDPVIEVDYSGPTAMVRAKAKGSTVITVTHPAKVIDLKIYVSVSETPPLAKNIALPSIVELIIDENKMITALTDGLSPSEINNIEWSLDDTSVIGISGELPLGSDGKVKGGKLFIKGKARGQAWLTASQGELGYVKKILVVCARTYDELANTYVMACEESYFRLKKGDIKAVSLVFGSAGFPQAQKAFITWEDADKNNVIKIHPPMNDYAEIEAINEGIARVRISHELISKPVDLTFEVSEELMPGQSYQFVYNGMMGLVVWKGAENDPAQYQEPYTKTATLSINPPGLSYNGIEWADEENPDKNIVKVSAGGTGSEYLLTGKAKGQTYVNFSHKSRQIPDDARILVYTAETVTELQQLFPIGISKPNYLLTIGDPTETIKITVPQQGAMGLSNAAYKAKLDKISWDYGSSGNNIISYTININDNDIGKYKQEVTIQGKNAGNCYFDVKYEGKVIERIYISVKARLSAEMNKRIVTENIIGLSPDTVNRKTSIGCNLSPEEKDELEWRTLNPAVVDIQPTPGDKTSCYLNAKGIGETEVVVSYRQIERFIKVYVDANPDQYRAVNLDNRYYHLRRNDILPLTAFHAALPCGSADQWEFYPVSNPFDNKVAEIKTCGKDKINIIGINEGIATIVLYNNECKTDVTFMAEVSSSAPLLAETQTDDWYMTALKTVYALDPAKTMDVTRVSVGGIRFSREELVKIEWNLVSEETGGILHKLADEPGYKPVLLTFNNRRGEFVDIMPNNKTGTAVIRASHPRSVNDIDITVICDAQAVLASPVPHITADREIVKLQLNEEADITVAIQELYEDYDIGHFKAESDNPQRVAVETTGNRVRVKGVNFGQALVTVTHPKLEGYAKKIIVIVMAGDTSLVYLTTKQNFVVLEKGGYQAVEVELAGYSDVNSRNYIWSTDDHDIISISDSGKSAVITAKNVTKTAKIMVQHISCIEYPLYIYVRVTEKNTGNPVYITTPNNIVAIKEGSGIQVKANLANGGGHELSQFTWSSNDRNLIELNYSGDTAMVKGLTPGTARIQIWHPSSLNSITMLVVVEPLEPNNGIYIATDSQLIEMTTAESQRLIRARLVGGTPEDVYGFQWQISSFSSVLKQGGGQSYQPVSILANADTCYVQPVQGKYEGEAIITISHPKTGYRLDIKVIITDATDIKFAQSYITINQYEQVVLNLTAPANGALNLNVDNKHVVSAYATNTMCVLEGLQEGTTIVRISNVGGTKSDELVVRVNKVDLTGYAYIHVLEGLMWNKTLKDKQYISIQIRGAKNEDDEIKLLNALGVSISNTGILRISNDGGKTRGSDNKWTWKIEIEAIAAGISEVQFKIPETNNLLGIYPDLKNVIKKVYFKINEGENIYSVDKSSIQMFETSMGEMITATIDMGKSGGLKADQIQWVANDLTIIEIVQKIPPNNESGVSIVHINALKAGKTWIDVKFGTAATKIVFIDVAPIEYVKTDKSTISISPGKEEKFIIYSNPNNEEITFYADSNIGIDKIEGRQAGTDEAWTRLNKFICGRNGYEIKVLGGELEGTVRLTFTMEKTQKKSMVTVSNIKNYYIRWIGKSSLRFQPDEPETGEKVKIFYECNPAGDWLEFNGGNFYDKYFKVICDETCIEDYTENGVTKKTKYIKLIRNQKDDNGKSYYASCSLDKNNTESGPLPFRTKQTGQQAELPVYIYYEKIDVTWKKNTSYKPASKSNFDGATYAISLAPDNDNELWIDLAVPDEIQRSAITWKEYQKPDGITVNWEHTKGIGGNALGFRISRAKFSDEKYNPLLSTMTKSVFVGVLTVKYEYYNGNSSRTVFERKFLVYANYY